jgi:hypothetical protein
MGRLRAQLSPEEFDLIVQLAELFIQHAFVGGGVGVFDLAASFADAQLQALNLSRPFPLGIGYFKQHPLHVLTPHP